MIRVLIVVCQLIVILLLAADSRAGTVGNSWSALSLAGDTASNVVEIMKQRKKDDADDGDDDEDEAPKKKGKKKKGDADTSPGERSCPSGYVVLDKPNKYGAFCEPADTSKQAPAKEPEKCKFGMIGSPPDCHCPEGTEFQGYKGCVAVRNPCIDVGKLELNFLKCNLTRKKPNCRLIASGGVYTCCCPKGDYPILSP
jgi:hypothetical protein